MIHWQLARLYAALGDHDITLILYETVAKHPSTVLGIKAFLNCHYQEAFKQFNIADDDKSVNRKDFDKQEISMWTNESIRCYKELMKWDDVYTTAHGDMNGEPMTVYHDLEQYKTYAFLRFYRSIPHSGHSC